VDRIRDDDVRALLAELAQKLHWYAQRAVPAEQKLLLDALAPIDDALGARSTPPEPPALPESWSGGAIAAASQLQHGVDALVMRPFLASRRELRDAIRALGDARAILLEGMGQPVTLHRPEWFHLPLPKRWRRAIWQRSAKRYDQLVLLTLQLLTVLGVASFVYLGWFWRAELKTFVVSTWGRLTAVAVCVIAGPTVFYLRKTRQYLYGSLEVAVSIVMAWQGSLKLATTEHFAGVVACVGAIYVYVRGRDNMLKAPPRPPPAPWWR
jgi:hypothetical protein